MFIPTGGRVEIGLNAEDAEDGEIVDVAQYDDVAVISYTIPGVSKRTLIYEGVESNDGKKYGVLSRMSWNSWDIGMGDWHLHRDEEAGPAIFLRTSGGGYVLQYFRDGLTHRSGERPALIISIGGGTRYEYFIDGVRV